MQSKSKQNRIFLIDGYAMFYRSHFALIRNPLINSKGMHTSALFGFSNQMIKLLRKENPDTIIAAFDSKEKTFRHEKYPEYKATREKMPDEMIDYLKRARAHTRARSSDTSTPTRRGGSVGTNASWQDVCGVGITAQNYTHFEFGDR